MALWQKQTSLPVDRALAELEAEIAALERQTRQLSVAPAPVKPASPAETMTKFVKEILTPPSGKPMAPTYQVRKDLFDVPADPMKDLEAEPIAFAAAAPEPDLFGHPVSARSASEPATMSTPPAEKLARYLGSSAFQPHRELKHVRRQTKNRFFMWLGLSFVALCLLWIVIR